MVSRLLLIEPRALLMTWVCRCDINIALAFIELDASIVADAEFKITWD